MNKVITINLNGRGFQVEEQGYEALQNYLRSAEQQLKDDPDKAEIMSDLEQALGEKLGGFLQPHKTVVTQKEVEEIIAEMGPVQADEKQQTKTDASGFAQSSGGAKRLYRISQGEMLAGVCMGLAAYFNVDVTVVRIIFVILGLLTHGIWILVYIVMAIVVPHANTSAEKAAASGAPFTAQEFINRARGEYQKFADSGQWHQWKQEWKQKAREEKRKMKQQYRAQARAQFYGSGASPFMGLLTAVLSVLWVLGLASLISKHMVLGVGIPAGVPLWIAILVWLCIYGIIMSPLKMFRYRRAYQYSQNGVYHHHDDGLLDALAWMAFFVVLGWALWTYVPGSHIYFQKVLVWGQHVMNSVRHKL